MIHVINVKTWKMQKNLKTWKKGKKCERKCINCKNNSNFRRKINVKTW